MSRCWRPPVNSKCESRLGRHCFTYLPCPPAPAARPTPPPPSGAPSPAPRAGICSELLCNLPMGPPGDHREVARQFSANSSSPRLRRAFLCAFVLGVPLCPRSRPPRPPPGPPSGRLPLIYLKLRVAGFQFGALYIFFVNLCLLLSCEMTDFCVAWRLRVELGKPSGPPTVQ
jgi:hypothetical protein